MSRNDIYEKLCAVFQDVFDDDSISLCDGTTADDIEEWDSLSHINLITSVEDEFGIRFDMKAVQQMKNVGEMVDEIEKLIVE